VYGETPEDAIEKVNALAKDVLTDRRAHGEVVPDDYDYV
jgi:hypothetical protein